MLEAHTRDQMSSFYDFDLLTDNPMMVADYLASPLLNLLLQTTKVPTYTMTRTTLGDNKFE